MGGGCGGCNYHTFPYESIPPILVEEKRENQLFENKEDVWKIIDLLIEEVHENNKKGMEFDLAQSINAQLPFFTCRNIIIDKKIQKDIQRYVYCKDLGVSPYEGDFNKHPAKWVDKYFVIRKSFAKLESNEIKKAKGNRK